MKRDYKKEKKQKFVIKSIEYEELQEKCRLKHRSKVNFILITLNRRRAICDLQFKTTAKKCFDSDSVIKTRVKDKPL